MRQRWLAETFAGEKNRSSGGERKEETLRDPVECTGILDFDGTDLGHLRTSRIEGVMVKTQVELAKSLNEGLSARGGVTR